MHNQWVDDIIRPVWAGRVGAISESNQPLHASLSLCLFIVVMLFLRDKRCLYQLRSTCTFVTEKGMVSSKPWPDTDKDMECLECQ